MSIIETEKGKLKLKMFEGLVIESLIATINSMPEYHTDA